MNTSSPHFQTRALVSVLTGFAFLLLAGSGTVLFVGVLTRTEPFEMLLAWNEDFKQGWERPTERAPIPHAELLTLSSLAEKGGVELAVATNRLTARGITGFTADTVVANIAEEARMSAQQVFEIMVTPSAQAGDHAKGAGGGVGWKTLAQFCADENIQMNDALARLNASGIKASGHLTLREIASNAGARKPYELLEIIRPN